MTARRSLARPGMRARDRSFRPVTKLPGTVGRRHMADCPRQHALAGSRSPSRSHGERKVTSHPLRACRGHRIRRAAVAGPGACGCLLRSVSPAHAARRLVPATDRIWHGAGQVSSAVTGSAELPVMWRASVIAGVRCALSSLSVSAGSGTTQNFRHAGSRITHQECTRHPRRRVLPAGPPRPPGRRYGCPRVAAASTRPPPTAAPRPRPPGP